MERRLALLAFVLVLASAARSMADQPQWGERATRNMISPVLNLPASFEPGQRDSATGDIVLPDGAGVRWVARLGGQACGSPVVAGGRVFVGTNNDRPRDDRIQGDRGVLMCFDEKTGAFLWQLAVPKLLEVKWADWRGVGFMSPPTVVEDRAYAVTNRCQVVCLDVHGLANGNEGPFTAEGQFIVPPGESPLEPTAECGDIVWLFDMYKVLGVEPHNAANGSILVDGNLLYVPTSNGVEWTHSYVVNPEAPSLIVLDKRTGKLVARDAFGIGADITHGQWSSPAMGVVDGRKLVLFAAGNGCLYATEAMDEERLPEDGSPALLKPAWKYNGEPRAQAED
ncbi:MAG: PQQ-binding-like beta-propeller repeat protein, partial [Patescibacteria group bacterium]|nr:PQQ-binding-like beta-propeller repeat protein [Patescibacteria group bacterium]